MQTNQTFTLSALGHMRSMAQWIQGYRSPNLLNGSLHSKLGFSKIENWVSNDGETRISRFEFRRITGIFLDYE